MPLFSSLWQRRDCLLAAAAWMTWRVAGAAWLEGSTSDNQVALRWSPAQAQQAVGLLAQANQHGLHPDDYLASSLADRLPAALAHPDAPMAHQFADDLGRAMRQFLHDLAFGRVDPRQVHQQVSVAPRAGFDPGQALVAALANGRLADAVQAAVPPLPIYGQYQAVLMAMQALAGDAAWAQPLPALPKPAHARLPRLDPGATWSGTERMALRLQRLGDLAADGPVPARYEGELVEAVRRFQARHGLGADGVVGASTRAALEVTPVARARQVALAMERLRWTPLFLGPRMIVVNIPEFVLRAYEVVDGQIQVRLTMRVIVGEALDHETPLFDERMRSIEFSPYWNVPPSIAKAETVPRLRRDPAYWDRQGFEFVGGDGSVDTVLTPSKLDAVLAARLRIRQRPGPTNALGDIKFVFPNRDNIYLHHTPSPRLFARQRRDFSHGCIRVEAPVALARFVLQDDPRWNHERIEEAMNAGVSRTIRLRETLPVLIAYSTVVVKHGQVYFHDDLYGHDRLLDEALRARSAALARAPTPWSGS
ncbi:MAG: L,D-transpeptidase family protein [Hydrogenophaga sp.]|uniref:L,D-transpeptidase family protein n=1 Tax=Hydrogenophaga sp. TaxID=1904254 RepID=UPI001DC90418|nr:L,D-transpeptidase family protein [Hydrogenophaga sp.]MBX3611518.1 L,D-transpeptidase family protein [Hydrogenophaga sp.]